MKKVPKRLIKLINVITGAAPSSPRETLHRPTGETMDKRDIQFERNAEALGGYITFTADGTDFGFYPFERVGDWFLNGAKHFGHIILLVHVAFPDADKPDERVSRVFSPLPGCKDRQAVMRDVRSGVALVTGTGDAVECAPVVQIPMEYRNDERIYSGWGDGTKAISVPARGLTEGYVDASGAYVPTKWITSPTTSTVTPLLMFALAADYDVTDYMIAAGFVRWSPGRDGSL